MTSNQDADQLNGPEEVRDLREKRLNEKGIFGTMCGVLERNEREGLDGRGGGGRLPSSFCLALLPLQISFAYVKIGD